MALFVATAEFTMDREESKGYDVKEHLEWALNEACTTLERDNVQVTYRLTIKQIADDSAA